MMYNKVGIDGLTMISIVFKYHINYAGITMIKYYPPKVLAWNPENGTLARNRRFRTWKPSESMLKLGG